MSIKVRGRYDGRAIVPDEPLDLPQDQPVEMELTVVMPQSVNSQSAQAAWERLMSRRIYGLHIPDSAIRRESIYEDCA